MNAGLSTRSDTGGGSDTSRSLLPINPISRSGICGVRDVRILKGCEGDEGVSSNDRSSMETSRLIGMGLSAGLYETERRRSGGSIDFVRPKPIDRPRATPSPGDMPGVRVDLEGTAADEARTCVGGSRRALRAAD